jgi:hypothetical protein
VKIGLDGAGDVSKGLNKVSGSLKELFSMSIQTKLTLAGIAAGLTGAAFSAGKTGASLMAFSKGFDLSIASLQRWQQAGQNFGVSGDEITSSIEGIQNAIADAMTHGGMNEAFSKLAIDPRKFKDAFGVIEELRKRIQGGQIDVMRTYSSGLISQNMFQMLRQTTDPLKMRPTAHILTMKEAEDLRNISVKFEKFGQDLKRTMESFIVKNEPLITKLLTKIEELLTSLLGLIGKAEDKTGFIPRVARGENIGAAAGKSVIEGSARLGQGMFDLVKISAKNLVDEYKLAHLQQENKRLDASKLSAEAFVKDLVSPSKPSFLPASPASNEPEMFVTQTDKNTMIINFGDIDISDRMSSSWQKETDSVVRQLVNKGGR